MTMLHVLYYYCVCSAAMWLWPNYSCGWAIMFYIALAIFARSPSAYRALRSLSILQLPCDATLRGYMRRHSSAPGINEDILFENARNYDEYKSQKVAEGFKCPLGKGVLIYDEVKVSIE